MSTDIIRLSADDFDEAMTFLNAVFAEHAPHDFANLLPSIYQPTDELMRCNYAVRESGRLAAIVGVFPIHWRVGGVTLKVAGVGGVAVHPDSRGKGYMKRLMNHAVDQMRAEGYDLSYLGGRRQRYAYFGYEVAATSYNLLFLRDNIRHTFAGQDEVVTLESVPDDADTNARLKAIQETQPQYCVRPVQSFGRYLRNWHSQPLVAQDKTGQIVGYLSPNRYNRVANELVADTPESAAQIVRAWSDQVDETVSVLMQAPACPTLRRLNAFAEYTRIETGGNWQVFNWPHVLDTLLKAQHAANTIPQGKVVLKIEDQPQTLVLTVDAAGARCEHSDHSPDLSLDPFTATRLLFGPAAPATIMPLPDSAAILAAWCPLPLGFSNQDHI